VQKDSSKNGTKEEKESFHNKTRVQNKRISFKQKGKKETSQKTHVKKEKKRFKQKAESLQNHNNQQKKEKAIEHRREWKNVFK